MRVADALPVPAVEPVERAALPGVGAAPRRFAFVGRISVVGWRLIALAAFLALWHLASIPAGKLLLPSPLDIVPAFLEELRCLRVLTLQPCRVAEKVEVTCQSQAVFSRTSQAGPVLPIRSRLVVLPHACSQDCQMFERLRLFLGGEPAPTLRRRGHAGLGQQHAIDGRVGEVRNGVDQSARRIVHVHGHHASDGRGSPTPSADELLRKVSGHERGARFGDRYEHSHDRRGRFLSRRSPAG